MNFIGSLPIVMCSLFVTPEQVKLCTSDLLRIPIRCASIFAQVLSLMAFYAHMYIVPCASRISKSTKHTTYKKYRLFINFLLAICRLCMLGVMFAIRLMKISRYKWECLMQWNENISTHTPTHKLCVLLILLFSFVWFSFFFCILFRAAKEKLENIYYRF